MSFTHIDLFAGIGGFSKAVEWLGGTTVAFVEWDSWCRRVLAKHWPEGQFFGDIHAVSAADLHGLGHIDLITGGYPCQPFSAAGKRMGHNDPRHLWPEMHRVINTVRPRLVLAENVDGHVTMGLDTVLADLEADGYTAGAIVVPAASVNALHRRSRVWIMAHAESQRHEWSGAARTGGDGPANGSVGMASPSGRGCDRGQDQQGQGSAARRGTGVGSEILGHANGEGPQGRRQGGHGAGERAAGPAGGEPVGDTRQVARALDPGPDGIRPGLVRRPSAGPDWIRAAWADGSWEHDLPRVVVHEPERRQKLQGAGNAIVPVVAYEILSVMLGDKP